jgi:hypothetical protein
MRAQPGGLMSHDVWCQHEAQHADGADRPHFTHQLPACPAAAADRPVAELDRIARLSPVDRAPSALASFSAPWAATFAA